MTDRAQLQQKLNTIEAELPRLMAEHPHPADLWPAFAGVADDLLESAGHDHFDWVTEKLDAILSFNGIFALRSYAPPLTSEVCSARLTG